MKKIILILCALLLCLALCSCALFGGAKKENDPLAGDQNTQTPIQEGDGDKDQHQTPTTPVQSFTDDEDEDPDSGEDDENSSHLEDQLEIDPVEDPDDPGEHIHDFSLKVVSDKYDTGDGKNFYYSCACGEMGTETFYSSISIGTDDPNQGWGEIIGGQTTGN